MTRLTTGHPLGLGSVMYLDGVLLPQELWYFAEIKQADAMIPNDKSAWDEVSTNENSLGSECLSTE